MKENLKKEMLCSIDVTRQAIQNSMEVSLECYTEILSRLDLLSYLINCEEKNSFNA